MAKTKIKNQTTIKKTTPPASSPSYSYKPAERDAPRPFVEHVNEVRRRLMYIMLSLAVFSMFGYAVHDFLLRVIHKPIGETLYYTSPVGGLNFLIKLCLSLGLVLSLPVIFYHLDKFIRPIVEDSHRKLVITYSVLSFFMAIAGIVFAYFISLPAALHFLMGFSNETISSLVGVNEYYNFALAYLLGYALLFQLPIVISFINRIKPLKPSVMMKAQRWVILGSFIVAAILTPTPDPANQFIMAAPAILFYQFGIVIVWMSNRGNKHKRRTSELKLNKFDRTIADHLVELANSETEAPLNLVPKSKPRGVAIDIMPATNRPKLRTSIPNVATTGLRSIDVVHRGFQDSLVA